MRLAVMERFTFTVNYVERVEVCEVKCVERVFCFELQELI